ncbi:unnamed protein product, partial [marine sediment metagenome]
VVFTADHGEEFFEHNGLGHGQSLFEELVRVPLVFKLPSELEKEYQSRLIKKPVSLTNFGHNLLKILNLTQEIDQDWFDASQSNDVFVEANFMGPELKGLRRGNLKLIWDIYNDSFALYNLDTDPEERRDLSWGGYFSFQELKEVLEEQVNNDKEKYDNLFKNKLAPPEDLGDVPGY